MLAPTRNVLQGGGVWDRHYSSRNRFECPQNDKNYVTQNMVCSIMLVSCCTNPNKRKITTCTRTCSYSSKISTQIEHGKNKIQPFGTILSNFSDNITVLRGHQNCCRFATVLRAPKSPSQGGGIWDRRCGWSSGRITLCRTRKTQRQRCFQSWICSQESAIFF